MFITIWIKPMWMKLQVMVLHQSPVSVNGPKFAPHSRIEKPDGVIRLTPLMTIATKRATLT